MSVSTFPYVVLGVTGRTGAATADALLRASLPVRVVVRDRAKARLWEARGAEVVVADLTDLGAMTIALRNSQGAYAVSPQQYALEDLFEKATSIAENTARAAVEAGLPKIVALSSVGADREGGTGWIGMNRTFEQHLVRTGIPTVFLRAAFFMENWTPMVQEAVHSGTLASFLAPAERAYPMVATIDVGRAAAALLQERWTGNRAINLTGPRDYTPQDVATVVARAINRHVDLAVLPESKWPTALAGANFSEQALAGFIEMTKGLNSLHINFQSDASASTRAGTTALEPLITALAQGRQA